MNRAQRGAAVQPRPPEDVKSPIRLLAHFIDGAFVPPASGEYLEDMGPATGEVIARIPRGNAADVDAAVGAARRAFHGSWSLSTRAERADLCDAIAARIAERAKELAELESLDTG